MLPAVSGKKKHTAFIEIKGARVHNLKNIELKIPHRKLIVITGVSGSGKSSLAYDTVFAEGQRRYVESLSAYARQFLGRMHKPEADSITGMAPAIAIRQKVISRSSRSTVGTSTEIYDYLKLLFARIGKTFSPVSGKEVKKHSVSDVVNYISSLSENSTVNILTPLDIEKIKTENAFLAHLRLLHQQGFSRVAINGRVEKISEILSGKRIERGNFFSAKIPLFLVVDRIILSAGETDTARIADSVQTAFFEGKGNCTVEAESNGRKETMNFSNRFEEDGIEFEEPSVHLFSFNNPLGACRTCQGFGSIIGIDENLVIPNKNLSVYEDAVACWRGEKMSEWKNELVRTAHHFSFPIHRPFYELSANQKKTFVDRE